MDRKFLRQGGKKIEVVEMPNTFTAIFASEGALARSHLRAARGPNETVTPMSRSVYRFDVCTDDPTDCRSRTEAAGGRVLPAYRFKDEDDTTDILLTDQLLVAFGINVSTRRIEYMLIKHQLEIIKEYRRLQRTYLVRILGARNPLDVSEALSSEPEFVFAEPNVVSQHHIF